MVVGGPGGSGSSTISKILSRKWYLHRINGGELIRKKTNNKSDEKYIEEDLSKNSRIDLEVDKYLLKMSFQANTLIESKVFAALATENHIPTTVKIWLHANVETSVKRIFQRENWKFDKNRYLSEIKKLKKRKENDRERFLKTYNVDILTPEKYNDIVIDSSKMDIHNTVKHIIDKIKQNNYLKSQLPPDYLKY